MKSWFNIPAVQISLCLAAYAALGYYLGKFALVFASPLLAAFIARPVMALVSSFRHGVRSAVWLPVHGQHYVHGGITIHVVEDDNHCRWVSLADVRKLVKTIPNERTLANTYPGRLQSMGTPASPHMRDDALIAHLSKVNQPAALKLRTWAERNIALPGRKIRKDLGINIDTPAS